MDRDDTSRKGGVMGSKERIRGLVSICMPAYNGGQFIRAALASVLHQTYQNFEIIVTDDCSSDNTVDIVRSFSDPRIRLYLNEKNLGLVGNWNYCVSLARGEYIKLMGDDDLLVPITLEKQICGLDSERGISFCIGANHVIDASDKVIMERRLYKRDRILDGTTFARKALRGRNIFGEPVNLMYRGSSYDQIGGYDSSFCYSPDWDYGIRLAYTGKGYYCSDFISAFRISSSSETSRLHARKQSLIADTDALFEKHKALGKIRLSSFDRLYFRMKTRMYMIVRIVILSNK